MKKKSWSLIAVLMILALLFTSAWVFPPRPIVGGDCEGAWVRVVGGHNKLLALWVDGVKVFQQKVSHGFEKFFTMGELGLDPCKEHIIKARYAGRVAKAYFGGPGCCEVTCWPRLNVWVNGCIPHGLTISGYFDFDANNYSSPTGRKYIDKPWEGNPFWVDLDKRRTFRFWGWTAEGGSVYLFDVTTTKECPEGGINKYYTFLCPTPAPAPPPPPPELEEVEELPVTGFAPQSWVAETGRCR